MTLTFERGEFVALDGKRYDDRIAAIQALQAVASRYAVGRDMHVGDTIIGIKGRVGFEAAAPMVIIKAHHMLEKHTLTKWQLFWKDQISAFYGNHLHEGQYYDPVMRDMEAMLEEQPADRQRRRVRRSAPLPLRSRRYRQPARPDEQHASAPTARR